MRVGPLRFEAPPTTPAIRRPIFHGSRLYCGSRDRQFYIVDLDEMRSYEGQWTATDVNGPLILVLPHFPCCLLLDCCEQASMPTPSISRCINRLSCRSASEPQADLQAAHQPHRGTICRGLPRSRIQRNSGLFEPQSSVAPRRLVFTICPLGVFFCPFYGVPPVVDIARKSGGTDRKSVRRSLCHGRIP